MTRAAVWITVTSCDAEPRAGADSQLRGVQSESYCGRNSSMPALCLPAFQ